VKYRTIVADPPWRYQQSRIVTTSKTARTLPDAERQYPTMSNEEIAALPVGMLAEDDAHLYLWVTNPRLFGETKRGELGPIDIITAWGFEYRTLLTWVKTGTLGLGYYFRGMTEHVLFCTRGHAPIPVERRERNVLTAARGRHSQKPEAFLDLVERVSLGPYLELFARRQRLGWDTWGNEALEHVEVTTP
jgi:N6-adenosine-specific RNA methylase IME4